MHRKDVVGALERLASQRYVAFAPQQPRQVRERYANTGVEISVGGCLNGQRTLVCGAGRGQVAGFFENQPEVAQLGGDVRMVRSALLLTQCDSALEQRSRGVDVVLFGQHIAQVGEVSDDGRIVSAEDGNALIEDELKQGAGPLEVTLLE